VDVDDAANQGKKEDFRAWVMRALIKGGGGEGSRRSSVDDEKFRGDDGRTRRHHEHGGRSRWGHRTNCLLLSQFYVPSI
jgi:hypothetical protein